MFLFVLHMKESINSLRKKYYSDVPNMYRVYWDFIKKNLKKGDVFFDAGCGNIIAMLKKHKKEWFGKYCIYVDPKIYAGVGCGTGDVGAPPLVSFMNRFSKGYGADLDLPVKHFKKGNVEIFLSDLANIPLKESSVDVIASRMVCEHFEDPVGCFKEMSRVLKKNGKIVIITPNKYDYVSLANILIPYKIREFFLTKIDQEYDNFKTYYRCNTASDFKKVAKAAGLSVNKITPMRFPPVMFSFSPLLFRLATFYDILIDKLHLNFLKGAYIVIFEKE